MGGADEPKNQWCIPGVETIGELKGQSLGFGWTFFFFQSGYGKMTFFMPFPFLSMGNLSFFWFMFMCEMLCKGLNLDPNGQRGRYQEAIAEVSFMVVSQKSKMYVS